MQSKYTSLAIGNLSFSIRYVVAILLVVSGFSTTIHAATVNVSASPTSVAVGSLVSVYFDIFGLGPDELSAYSFAVGYDDTVLGFSGFSFTDPSSRRNELDLPEVTSFGFAGSVSVQGVGVLDAFGLSGNSPAVLDGDQAKSFRYLTLNFDALSASAATQVTVDLASTVFGDALAAPLNVRFQSTHADITVNAGVGIPEPSGLSLCWMAIAGAALAMQRRRRRPVASTIGAAIAVATLALSGVALAQPTPQISAGIAQIDGIVVKAHGMRQLVRAADGREFWVTVKSKLGSSTVGARVTGQAVTRGDAVEIVNPVYSAAP